ncbi:undecaprenyl-diphosphate phosphatase [bacterium]|nr:undecaprenyl-diphosphate phosphatase [bacterium]
MTIHQAVLLGILQGFTELLPISSSAHLYIFPWLLGWHYQGLSFDVALHLGTLVGLVAFLLPDWIKLIGGTISGEPKMRRLLLYIIIACIPGALFGALLEKQAEDVFRSPSIIAITMSSFGLLLLFADIYGRRNEKGVEDVGWKEAIIIGLSQALAIIPGVSRSGATMTAGLFTGLKKEESARFSFLLATPIIAGAALWEGRKIVSLMGVELLSLIFGFVSAAIASYIAVWFLLRFLRKGSFIPFVVYRFIFALLVLLFIIINSYR